MGNTEKKDLGTTGEMDHLKGKKTLPLSKNLP